MKREQCKSIILKTGAITACTVLALGIGTTLCQGNSNSAVAALSQNDSELPLLTIDVSSQGSMGFEGYMAYNIDELVNENPWKEDSKITHLPVMKNTLTFNELEYVDNPDMEAMKLLLKQTASKLGMDTQSLSITDNKPDDKTKKKLIEKLSIDGSEVPEIYFDANKVSMADKHMQIEVDSAMVVTVHFEPAVALPEKYNLTHNASYDDIYNVAMYLKEEYKDYINMENPQINITGGDYSYDGNQMYKIEFFDNSGNETQRLLNYNFNYITFACDDEGKLFISRIYRPNLTNVIGNYPIISKETALALLENNSYITTVPHDFPGTQYVRKIELIYRSGRMEKTYMPYYRIFVELPSRKLENGLNTYGAYYVPAVEGKYLKNMPAPEIRFN